MKKIVFIILILDALRIYSQTITTVAGNGLPGYAGDGGTAITAQLYSSTGVALDAAGNIYIADQTNNRIRKVNTTGIITTIAGSGTAGFAGDGGPATTAQLNNPWGVAVDGIGNVYIADYSNHRIRKVNSSGIISTVAGTGTLGFSGDGGAAILAQLNNPIGLAVDGLGNIYIADTQNNRIRFVNSSGIITTFAGNGTAGYSGDAGPATAAEFDEPSGLALDGSGGVLITDASNNVIRKVNNSGFIFTIAGNGTPAFSGDGGFAASASFNGPIGIAIDGIGNVYIADTYNGRIRKINSLGIISTIAGIGSNGFSGDGGLATSAQLAVPTGVALDGAGNQYIADQQNNRIRKISSTVGIEEYDISNHINIFPVPNNGSMTLDLSGAAYHTIKINDVLGREVYGKQIDPSSQQINLQINIGNVPNGIYFIELTNSNDKQVKKFIKE